MLAAEVCIDGSENNLYIIFRVAGQGRRIDASIWMMKVMRASGQIGVMRRVVPTQHTPVSMDQGISILCKVAL